jgi:TolB-like protein/Tfp pilus assembly protein PilF
MLDQTDQDSSALILGRMSPQQIRDQLEKVLSGRTFGAAEGQKALLRYVVEQVIQGRGGDLKEYSVGVEAFARGESFDPRQDTIVRTEARNVRQRLARYYADEGKDDSILIELPKGGYTPRFLTRLQEPPSPLAGSFAEAAPVLDPQTPGRPPQWAWWRRNSRLLASGLLAASAILAVSLFYLARSVSAGGRPTGDPASIAVLPFVSLSDSKEREILSDGLTEELINSLVRIPGLHVVGRSSVFQYKGKTLDIRQVGHDLGVHHVLEGSVRVSGGRVRIDAQLEDASNGYHLWSESFDRKLDDALAIQGEISHAIMQSLGVELAGTTNLKAGVSPAPAAYQDYLKGLYFLNKNTAENVRTGTEYFERATAADPNFALAYRGLADAYGRIAAYTSTPSQEVIPKIRTAASKALELDDTLGEAHLDLARAYTFEWNWPAAEHEFRRALDLSPSSAVVHRYYGDYLLRVGNLEQALAEGRIAMDLDPFSASGAQFVARVLYYLGRYDDATDQLENSLVLNPANGTLHQALGLVSLARPATYPRGVKESELAHQLMEGDPWTSGQLGYAYGLTGKTKEAMEILKQLLGSSHEYIRALPIARVYVGLGDREDALEWLQKAADQHDVALILKADPLYGSLRSDRRFASLTRQWTRAAAR